MKYKIILDTNVLMAVSQFKLDVFSQVDQFSDYPYELFILDKTILELNNIFTQQTGKNKQAAKLALSIIKQKKLSLIPTEEGQVDDLLVAYSLKGYVIVTQDLILKKRIKKAGGIALTIRQKRK